MNLESATFTNTQYIGFILLAQNLKGRHCNMKNISVSCKQIEPHIHMQYNAFLWLSRVFKLPFMPKIMKTFIMLSDKGHRVTMRNLQTTLPCEGQLKLGHSMILKIEGQNQKVLVLSLQQHLKSKIGYLQRQASTFNSVKSDFRTLRHYIIYCW